MINEEYIEQVPVERVRTVQKPDVELREVETEEIINVPGTRVVEEETYHVQDVIVSNTGVRLESC
mgnify:FL=1